MVSKNFLVRSFNSNDLVRILEIEQKAHANPWSREFFSKQLANSAHALLGEQDGQTVGYLVYQKILDEAEILNLVTAVEYENQGCASLLLSHFLEMLQTSRVKRVYLEVASDNLAAIALYTRDLFESAGIRKDYYQRNNGRCDAILMSRNL